MVFEFLQRVFGGGPPRVSPQGWRDEDAGFPASATRRGRFRSPWEAVDAVEKAVKTFIDCKKALQAGSAQPDGVVALGNEQLELFAEAMQALYICDSDMAPRKGSYGRLAKILRDHLQEGPELVAGYPTDSQVSHLAEDLVDSGDADLANEGRLLDKILQELKR